MILIKKIKNLYKKKIYITNFKPINIYKEIGKKNLMPARLIIVLKILI